eukprot:tig00001006_g6223.t1
MKGIEVRRSERQAEDFVGEGTDQSLWTFGRNTGEDLALALVVIAAVLAVQLTALLLVYILVFRPIIQQLKDECGRATELIHMIPRELLPMLQPLHKFFASADNQS